MDWSEVWQDYIEEYTFKNMANSVRESADNMEYFSASHTAALIESKSLSSDFMFPFRFAYLERIPTWRHRQWSVVEKDFPCSVLW